VLITSAAVGKTVPLDVLHVAPLGKNQLIVYLVCSPEHCWNTFYLRKVEWVGNLPRVSCLKPIVELNKASDFVAKSLVPLPSDGGLEIHIVSSHEFFSPSVVKLISKGACEYQIGNLPSSNGS
jgi:hypothetical protein